MATANFDFTGLTVTRTYTFPDGTGTILLDTGSANIVTVGTITTGTWHGTKIGLAYGGTNADLSGTGGASQVLKQSSSGANITVGQLAASDISSIAVSQSATPTTGATVTVTTTAAPVKTVFINPAGTIAALTLAIADGTTDGQIMTCIFTKVITTLTITGNVSDPTTRIGPAVGAADTFVLAWVAGSANWQVVKGNN